MSVARRFAHDPQDDDAADNGAALSTADRLIPAAQVAERFGCTRRTLWNWEQSDLLVPVRINGRCLYRLSEVEALARHGGRR